MEAGEAMGKAEEEDMGEAEGDIREATEEVEVADHNSNVSVLAASVDVSVPSAVTVLSTVSIL